MISLDWNDPHEVNADLHCHSVLSDGTLTPEELALRAKQEGVHVWSLTDHDELGGLGRAQLAAQEVGLLFVPGVEISVSWCGHTIHIVGLNIDTSSHELTAELNKLREGRWHRAQEMGFGLAKVGIEGAFEGALKYVSNPQVVSRTHFARFLVESGVCEDMRSVFRHYLTPGKPGYVPHQWATLADAVTWIRNANGMAVIAHPGRYPLKELEMDLLIERFKALGGEGIEVVTGSHTVDQYQTFARRALRAGLKASRGSDFHSPVESRVNLGELPRLPDGCVPIWDNWGRTVFS